ncbi:hypothetical protein R52603_01766 [Paraburkholderia saeva]|jgi:hypothetical protein|uniref:Uncharacterized protein n=1 Tax=Paraburkholderia saeva TaxID=2777537 RepID=A0A9N8X1R2_9BURK|nr:hypothetical protein LMG31841_01281 [Paraburkholderia saeva]CAG4894293.1 hypothetical protein R52603_01766 [Paraburkholderia saeva]CAG4924059.1 hypothetical protein R70241_05225 [Paraburkholderia saeva]
MKRRTPRQLVRLLSDMRHSANCRVLRAAAASLELERIQNEEDPAPPRHAEDMVDSRQEVFAGARHEKFQ